jgi:meso-butanediol dehydrogenase/(S,S)-butanediol dehydrogenase/diacetyl reductase
VINLTRSVAIDHARENIRVNAVCPGPVDTPIIAGINDLQGVREAWDARVPMGRFARPEEIAAVVAFLASSDASYMTGQLIVVDGGNTIQEYKGPSELYY